MNKKIALFTLSFFLIAGCATKIAFVYDHPEMPSGSFGSMILALQPLQDQRSNPEETDKIFDTSLVNEINQIIQEEIKSTGLFDQIITIPEDKLNNKDYLKTVLNPDMLMSSILLEVKWEVPDYKALQRKAILTGALTGGIGGFIYGSTSTDVYGDSKFNFTLVDYRSGETLINKDYIGHYETKMSKFKCDSSSTKAEMIGKALKIALQQFKADLVKVIKGDR